MSTAVIFRFLDCKKSNFSVIGLCCAILCNSLCLTSASVASSPSSVKCQFPARWRGVWYQSSVGLLEITADDFLGKGSCHHNLGEFYVLNDSDDGCLSCILVIDRHPNVLQYKEGFCVSTATEATVCNFMSVDAYLYTLIAAQPSPSQCPFHDDFTLQYSDNEHGFCDSPNSSLIKVGDIYYLELRHCRKAALWHKQDFVIQCLGSWSEGSQQLLMVKLITATAVAKDQNFHCMKFSISEEQRTGTISMSEDANCWTIISSTEGPLVMKLNKTQKDNGPPETTCHFPAWINNSSWSDVASHHVSLSFSATNLTFTRLNTSGLTTAPSNKTTLQCRHLVENKTESFTSLTKVTDGAGGDLDYLCVHVTLRTPDTLTAYFAPANNGNTARHRQCHHHSQTSKVLVFRSRESSSSDLHPVPCPLWGEYVFSHPRHVNTDTCYTMMTLGCHDNSMTQFRTVCDDQVSDLTLKCVLVWQDHGDTFVVLRNEFSRKLNYIAYSPSRTPDHYRLYLYGSDRWWYSNVTSAPLQETGSKVAAMIKTGSCPVVSPAAEDSSHQSVRDVPTRSPAVQDSKTISLPSRGHGQQGGKLPVQGTQSSDTGSLEQTKQTVIHFRVNPTSHASQKTMSHSCWTLLMLILISSCLSVL